MAGSASSFLLQGHAAGPCCRARRAADTLPWDTCGAAALRRMLDARQVFMQKFDESSRGTRLRISAWETRSGGSARRREEGSRNGEKTAGSWFPLRGPRPWRRLWFGLRLGHQTSSWFTRGLCKAITSTGGVGVWREHLGMCGSDAVASGAGLIVALCLWLAAASVNFHLFLMIV